MTESRQRQAHALAIELATRVSQAPELRDVVAIGGAPTATRPVTEDWASLSLSDGFCGVALLFIELGRTGDFPPIIGHQLISQACNDLTSTQMHARLYGGPLSVAFAAAAGARSAKEYEQLLHSLDRSLCGQVRSRAQADRSRVAAGEPAARFDCYDAIVGFAGIGRYLLLRSVTATDGEATDALTDVLDVLVALALAPDIDIDGVSVPRWWVTHGLNDLISGSGHVNFGLAHGVSGPLALLSSAYAAGVQVKDQAEAIGRVVSLLDRWRQNDACGPYWPYFADLDGHRAPPTDAARDRDVWCYGSFGTARALHLAGLALGRTDWEQASLLALRGATEFVTERVADSGLCHGLAGILQVLRRTQPHCDEPWVVQAMEAVAALIIERFDDNAPYGYRCITARGTQLSDRPGFLEGAAGVALALSSYARDSAPLTPWDAALLIA